jgi:hypothetical protein
MHNREISEMKLDAEHAYGSQGVQKRGEMRSDGSRLKTHDSRLKTPDSNHSVFSVPLW